MNTEGHLTANGGASKVITVSAHMDEAAGNEYMDKTLEGVKFTVYARRLPWRRRQLQQHL